ncbi:MAG: hypothetical protein ACYS8W_14505 [Planctomycetota bacterium]
MRTAVAIAKPNIVPLRPEKNSARASKTNPFFTIRLTEEHKSVLRRFANLRLKRNIPRSTVLDLFESHAESRPNSSPVFYLQVLLPILDFEESRLARVAEHLDANHEHEVILDREREVIDYRITKDSEHNI